MKVLTHETLKILNSSSVNAGRNRNFYFDKLPIEEDKLYPVPVAFLHRPGEIRMQIILNEKGDDGWLDVSQAEFSAIPDIKEEAQGH